MIRTLRAFTWLRWRLILNSLRSAERRDTLERASRVASLVVPGLMVATAATSIVVSAVLGSIGGWGSVTHALRYGWLLPTIRVLLLLATVLAVLVPLLIGVQGGGVRFTRLLLLPIPRRTLHFVEVITSLADPWLAYVVPGLVGYACGLLAAAFLGGEVWYHRRAVDAVMALVAGLGMAFALASLSSLVAMLVSWIVHDRRRSEVFVVVVVLALSCVSIVPALVSGRLARQMQRFETGAGGQPPPIAVPGELPAWTVVLPSELYYQTVWLADLWPDPQAVLPLGALLLEGALLYRLSSAVRRLRGESAESVRSPRRRVTTGDRTPARIPGFWPGTSAVALAQTRTALRSVRGRLVVLLPGPLVAMLALLFRGMGSPGSVESLVTSQGYLALLGGIIFGLYAAQALTMNQFGSDGAGLTLQFLAPIRDVDIVRGKAVGCAMVIGAGALVSFACTLAVTPGGSAFRWLATLVGGAAAFLILCPVAAWFSAILPVSSDLSKTGSGGNPHNLAMFVGAALVAAAAAPAGAILLVFSPPVALFVMTLWLIAAGAIAYLLLGLAARTVHARRENLVLVAQGR